MNSATLFSVKYYVIDLFWCKKEIVICQKIILFEMYLLFLQKQNLP